MGGSVARAMLALATRPFTRPRSHWWPERSPRTARSAEFAIPVIELQRYELCDFAEASERSSRRSASSSTNTPLAPCSAACSRICMPATGGDRCEASARRPGARRLRGASVRSRVVARHEPAGRERCAPRRHQLRRGPVSVAPPYAEFNVENAADAIRGSVSRYLGLLASTLKRWQDAQVHFESALALNASMGARPWLAHTQNDYARTLLARDRRTTASRPRPSRSSAFTYRELGIETHARPPPHHAHGAREGEEASVASPKDGSAHDERRKTGGPARGRRGEPRRGGDAA